MPASGFGPFGAPREPLVESYARRIASPGVHVQPVSEFDLWRAEYAGKIITVRRANTTTKADLYYDINLTEAAENPQTLLSRKFGDVYYGKFERPVYTPHAYSLAYGTTDETAIQRPPIITLDGEDAGGAVVTPEGGLVASPLEELLSRVIYATDDGVFTVSPSENASIINRAIGRAGARGGGTVFLPPGRWQITSVSIPAGVTLRGNGIGSTVLYSTVAGAVVTIAGDGARVEDMTLDGVNVVSGSIGVYSKGNDNIGMRSVELLRFADNMLVRGGRRIFLDDVRTSLATRGAAFYGSLDTAGGDEIRDLRWVGGYARSTTEAAIVLEYVDMAVQHCRLADLDVRGNLTDGVKVIGSRFTRLSECIFTDNARHLSIDDDTPVGADNFIQGLLAEDCEFVNGGVRVRGTALQCLFDRSEFQNVEVDVATTADNPIILRDCVEDADVAFTGDGTKVWRQSTASGGQTKGSTVDDTPIKAISFPMEPGETAIFRFRAIANQVDGEGHAVFVGTQGARRDTSDLSYDGGLIQMSVGDAIVGATSGATGTVTAIGALASGTASLRLISGEFEDNEAIQVGGTTHAFVNGTITPHDAAMIGSLVMEIETLVNFTAGDAVLTAVDQEVQLTLTGKDSITTIWTAFLERMDG